MAKKRKRKNDDIYCICDTHTGKIFHTGRHSALKRLKLEYEALYGVSRITLENKTVLEERKRKEREAQNSMIAQQNEAYEKALIKDREKTAQYEMMNTLKRQPEERALLFDKLFLKKNPQYRPVLKRIKERC